MADDFIGISVDQDLAGLSTKLSMLPATVADAASDDIAKYMINVLRQYPSKKYVSRRTAYGTPFFTDRQRRWFFAALKSGELELPYRRTQTLSRGWTQIGGGFHSAVVNEVPYAALVMGDGQQSRMSKAIGWKTLGEVVKERAAQIYKTAEAAINKGIHKLGLDK